MITSIRRQETDILCNLHQKRDEELEPLLKKIDTVEAFLVNAQLLKVSHNVAATNVALAWDNV